MPTIPRAAVDFTGIPAVRVLVLRLDGEARPPGRDFGATIAARYGQCPAVIADAAAAPEAHTLAIDPAAHWQDALGLLDGGEAQQAARLRDEGARRAYVYAHAALRVILAQELGTAPASIGFTAGPSGKPRLAGVEPGIHFSLSRRPGFAALATGNVPLGIDIERVRDGLDIAGIAQRFFTAEEQSFLADAPPAETQGRFFSLWARKEALVKASGVGIDFLAASSALKSHVTLVDDEGDPRRYRVHQLSPCAGHALALAVQVSGSFHDE